MAYPASFLNLASFLPADTKLKPRPVARLSEAYPSLITGFSEELDAADAFNCIGWERLINKGREMLGGRIKRSVLAVKQGRTYLQIKMKPIIANDDSCGRRR